MTVLVIQTITLQKTQRRQCHPVTLMQNPDFDQCGPGAPWVVTPPLHLCQHTAGFVKMRQFRHYSILKVHLQVIALCSDHRSKSHRKDDHIIRRTCPSLHSKNICLSTPRNNPRNTKMSQTALPFLAILIGIAGYCSELSASPPNPNSTKDNDQPPDRIKFLTGYFMTAVGRAYTIATSYHSIIVLVDYYDSTYTSHICPLYVSLNPILFQWNAISVSSILSIFAGTCMRLSAYGELGRNFTFQLAAPDHLVTTGIYYWIQHPSYIGLTMVIGGFMSSFFRWDATPGCWTNGFTLLDGWGFIMSTTMTGFMFCVLLIRVRDEEKMLRGEFGKEWERWSRSTSRFIPGLI